MKTLAIPTIAFPYVSNQRVLFRVCLIILLSTFFILFCFQPFGSITHGYTFSGFLRILSYAVVASGSYFLYDSLLGKRYRSGWRIARSRYGGVVWNLIVLVLVTLNIFWCRAGWLGWEGVSWNDLGVVFCRVGIISVIPFAFVTALLLVEQQKKKDHYVHLLSNDTNPVSLRVATDSLLLLKSEENYVSVFYLREGRTEKKLMRGSLTYYANQVSPLLLRVHRSYLVNLQLVDEVNVNRSGGRLSLPGIDFSVPVTRKYLRAFQRHWSRM